MIRVLIVDDDVLYRRSIRSLLTWESLGFVVCGECVHGRDALNHMEEYMPNIVFTDMSMPQMNGIELIRALKQDYPMVRIIVLSSYDDFDFVKEAMKLGADDYILKHELGNSMDKFLSVLEETKAKIIDASSEHSFGKAEERQLILDVFMNRVLSGRIRDKKEIKQQLHRLIVYFRFDRYMLAVIKMRRPLAVANVELEERIELQEYDQEARQFRQAVLAMGDPPASSQRLVILVDDYTGVCIFNLKTVFSQSRMHEAVRSAFKDLFGNGMELCIGISGLSEGVSKLPESYQQADIAARQGFLYTSQSLTFHTGLPDKKLPKELLTHLNKLEEILGREDTDEANVWVQKLVEIIYSFRIMTSALEEVCQLINHLFSEWAAKKNVKMEEITRCGRISSELLAFCETREVFSNYFSGCFERAFSIEKLIPQTAHPRVRQAVEYINVHYHEPIGLRDVSQVLEISENYLSNLFKQETGLRFVEYLNEVRLHHAKRLVASGNLKVYEIARQCGFYSTPYFCRLFKEKTGMSLTKHRKQEKLG